MYNYNCTQYNRCKPRTAFNYKLIDAVDALPLTVAEVKLYLRVSNTADDALIEELIETASLCCESYTRRVLITKTFRTYRDCWLRPYIELRKSPLQSIESVKYYDTENVLQTLDASNYYTTDEPDYYSKILYTQDATLPSLYKRLQAIEIEFKAGYGDTADDIPADLKLAMKQHIAMMYENRGDCADATCSNMLPATAKNIYNKYKIQEIGGC